MFGELGNDELEAIRRRGALRHYPAGMRIFSEGDEADYIYFIDTGRVRVFIEKFSTQEEIQVLGAGQWLGEMALFHHNLRSACAMSLDDTRMLQISKQAFLELIAENEALRQRLGEILSRREEELVLREKLLDLSELDEQHRHIGIKGDPSMRESALTRERYQSIVDQLMPELVPVFKALLLERSAFRLFIGFNNGEIRISTIHDPFGEEFHPAKRLIDPAYLERHFPRVDYEEKTALIRTLYQTIATAPAFRQLPRPLQEGYGKYYETWQAPDRNSLGAVLEQLPQLRAIDNFYVRNATLSTIKDAIHLQFNCDGSHILNANGYRKFIEENI